MDNILNMKFNPDGATVRELKEAYEDLRMIMRAIEKAEQEHPGDYETQQMKGGAVAFTIYDWRLKQQRRNS